MSHSASVAVRCTAILLLSSLCLPPRAAAPEWKLVWSDEFNGPTLDYSRWGVAYDALGGGNDELQFYTDRRDNVRVEKGHLVIEARADDYNGMGTIRKYSSGRLRTKHRGDWKFGRIAVRARMPVGKGLWPAIWMLPTDNVYGGWAASGEIDIMEYRGHEPNRVHGSLHYGGTWPNNQHSTGSHALETGSFADAFHEFALEWEAGEIRWYVDGELYRTCKKWSSAGGAFPAPFDQRFHLLLNLAVGGRFAGTPDSDTEFPQRMLIDWVRVYQR